METTRTNFIRVENETVSSMTRMTQDGRKIRYDLEVLQQPQRARACGAGAKSSADRRPVDPPPIVQLLIKQVKPDNTEEDITASMNANYFLFATLENARVLAQPRNMPDKAPTVLTGTPVAGMTYLDRPKPAGYFIFPDLSVRHDGHFRLSFSLYEEVKSPEDGDETQGPPRPASPADSHVTHRLEVKSKPLQVFTAKTFPGLTESTMLSRVVAEQGCRVRIRRDVRMRKQSKPEPSADWNEYEDKTASARAKASRTPDAYAYAPPPQYAESDLRQRSDSNASHQSLVAVVSRKPSLQEVGREFERSSHVQYGGTAPHTPQNGYPSTPSYGPSPTVMQHSQPPCMQHQPQHPSMQPPPPPPPLQYQPQVYKQPPPTSSAQAPQYYGHQQAQQPQHHYSVNSYEGSAHAHRMSGEWTSAPTQSDYSRTSSVQSSASHPAYQAQPPPPQAYQPAHSHHHHTSSYDLQQSWRPEPVQPPTCTTAPTPPLSAKSTFASTNTLPPLSIAAANSALPKHVSPSTPLSALNQSSAPPSYYPNPHPHSSTDQQQNKRSYGSTFSTAAYDQAQKGGARPVTETGFGPDMLYPSAVDDDDEDEARDAGIMLGYYKRADGHYAPLVRPNGH